MRLPIKHLHDLGHREICFVCSDSEQAPLPYSADLRADAFLRACHDIDADIQPSLIRVPREVDIPEDFAISQLLSRFPRPTAICCQGDMTAIPLPFKLPHCGIRIPQDISLIGFDDSTYAKQLDLTTVHQSVDYLGAEAGKRGSGTYPGTTARGPAHGREHVSRIAVFNRSVPRNQRKRCMNAGSQKADNL